ncbi:sugar ABC transporter substrate-binding protein [Vallitalea guaymasensis]|uniref:sugar ABC transporter substrate-binding protein n=1 Tax=Vallitalea guaymasensis TaxID=1185412 RepID=UPI00272CFB44|nr:sugar ABC transporter substrate-binding protein [Vallitalea guaymasensis]
MFNTKKMFTIVMSILMAMSLFTGCGSKETVSNGDSQNTDGKVNEQQGDSKKQVKLSIWWASQDEFKQPLLDAIAEYEAEHPNVKIEPEWLANFDYYDNYKVALAGKTAPDIVKIDHVFVQTLGYNDQILELSEFGANDIKDKFVESAWKANMYQDNVYALPFDANTLALMYNEDLLAKAGKEVPTTYEELKDVALAINDLGEEGVYGYTVPVNPKGSGFLSFQFSSWVARNGGSILNDDWSASTLDSKEAVNALQQVDDLLSCGAIPPNVYLENEFYEGKIGLLEMGCWNINRLNADETASLNVAPLVSLKDGVTGYAPLGLYSLAITKATKHQQEAYDFCKFLATNKDLQLSYAKQTHLMPSLKDSLEDEMFNTPEWKVFVEQFKNTVSRPGSPAWPSIDKHLSNAIQKVLTGVAEPEEALKEAKELCDEEIKNIK